MDIDRKYKITAVSRAHGTIYTEKDGVFFKAADAALVTAVFDAYKRECVKLGADPRQLHSIDLLAERVARYKGIYPAMVKVPDVDQGKEDEFVNAPNPPKEDMPL